MDEEKCTILSEDAIDNGGLEETFLNELNKIECIECEESDFSCLNICDILSSSLIKSPVVYELLFSHGLISNGVSEDGSIDHSDKSKVFSLEENGGPPSFLQVYSVQPQVVTEALEDEEDEKGDYKCGWESCDNFFSCRKDLAQHVNNSHVCQDENSSYRCQWNGCARQGKTINARYRMLIHVRTHTREKPYGCEVCGKKFSRIENLKIHIRSHTGEKPYPCPVAGCNKAYSNSSDRFKHSKTHQEDKPYVCRVEGCDKRYTDPSSLRKHMKSNAHGGENKCKTESSSRAIINGSTQKENINSVKHVTSTAEITTVKVLNKPYACKVEGCGKRYTDPSSLRKHQRATSHGRDPNTFKPRFTYSKAMQNKSNIKLSLLSFSNRHKTTRPDSSTSESTTKEKRLKVLNVHKSGIKGGADETKPLDLSFTCTSFDELSDFIRTKKLKKFKS